MNSKIARRIYESTPKELKEKVRKEVNQKIMNELREKARQFAISKMTEERAKLYQLWNNSGRPIEHPFIDCLLSDFIQSQPINKEFGALNKQEKEFEDDSDLHKMRAEIDIFKKEFESEFKRLEALEPSKEPKEFNPFERVKELEKENERLRKRDCNATIQLCYETEDFPFNREDLKIVDVGVSDNEYIVESKILNDSLNQITQLQKKMKKLVSEGYKLKRQHTNPKWREALESAEESLTNKTNEQ